MAALVWLLVVLVGYPLLQIPALLYLASRYDFDSEAPPHPATRGYATYRDRTQPGTCSECGTANDPSFAYCGNCAAPLSASPG